MSIETYILRIKHKPLNILGELEVGEIFSEQNKIEFYIRTDTSALMTLKVEQPITKRLCYILTGHEFSIGDRTKALKVIHQPNLRLVSDSEIGNERSHKLCKEGDSQWLKHGN